MEFEGIDDVPDEVPVQPAPEKGVPKRAPLDPNRPRKPKTAYVFFGEATKAELSIANPGIRIETLTKLIGDEWKKLSDGVKEPYNRMAADDKKRYEDEMAAYKPSPEFMAAHEAARLKKVSADSEAGPSSAAPPTLAEENKALKKRVKELESQVAKQEKKIEKLEAKAEKAAEKASTAGKRKAKDDDDKAAKKSGGKKAKKEDDEDDEDDEEDEDEGEEDEGHYEEWCEKVLGKDGSKMDKELQKAYESKGEAGLMKLLAKRYQKEFS